MATGTTTLTRSAWGLAGALLIGIAGGFALAKTEDFADIPPDMLALIEKAEVAFVDQDAAAVGPYLAEDYSWYQVNDEGAKLMIQGRDQTVALLEGFFGNNDWTDSDVQRLGMLDNILVQVEIDHFGEGDTQRTIRSLNIYEFKDGLRWREWKFYPAVTD
ncbi:MAG: nuclear transport factor 2 family protein [Chromatiales bacterium]|nr:MAG: nuclear transport factor 2 family protein [Chromatiales bacterium]